MPPGSVTHLMQVANSQLQRGDLLQAEVTLRAILDADPANHWAGEELRQVSAKLMSGEFTSRRTDTTWIERMGSNWTLMGWALFAMWFVPGLFGNAALVVMLAGFLLWHTWLIIDMVDQKPAIWQVLAIWVMLLLAFLPFGGLLRVAAWVIYYLRFRE